MTNQTVPSLPPPRVVCFDLGGVLVRIRRSFQEATLAANLPLRHHPQLKSEAWQQKRVQLISDHQVGRLDFSAYSEALSDAVEALYSHDEIARIHQEVLDREYPGIPELVASLHQLDGIVTACLSNTNDAHWERLNDQRPDAEYPSVGKLHIRLASHLLGVAKPDLAIFRAAEEQFNASPEEIVFFDDLQKNVLAAREAGWRTQLVDYAGDPAAQIRRALRRWGLPLG
jgi:HAD superfamily hydrolase (TIGR01509 family)